MQPTVQWHDQQVPIPMAGQSSQATTSSFWKDTNGAAEGVITATAAAPGVALTPNTIPFTEAYKKRTASRRPMTAIRPTTMVHVIAEAVKRAGSTDPDKMVAAMEKTDYVGTVGRIEFYGQDTSTRTRSSTARASSPASLIQWQNGKQVTIWPADKRQRQDDLSRPSSRLPQQASTN